MIHLAVWPQQTWAKNWGEVCASQGGTGSPSNTTSPGARSTPYQVASWFIQPFGHNRPGPKTGGRALFGRVGSPCNTMWPALRPIAVPSGILIHPAVWPQQTWAENWGAAVLPHFGGAGSPSNTMSPRPRPTSMSSFILIYPTTFIQPYFHCAWAEMAIYELPVNTLTSAFDSLTPISLNRMIFWWFENVFCWFLHWVSWMSVIFLHPV